MKKFILFVFLPLQLSAQSFTQQEISRWEKQAKQVSIIRDNWGIPHIYGKTDADAVFGLLYAQCEDDFRRVEMNYIEKLGRLAEVNGETNLYDDLQIRMLLDPEAAIADYKISPAWLKKLLNAFADGINFYLYKHPEIKPALLTRFQPWWPLLWTDGSIGAINTAGISTSELKALYSSDSASVVMDKNSLEKEPSGSNGFAFSPTITESGNAILYINPHVTFYFRPEVHVVSDEGLNVYGAVTWGQFFVYQGFNEHCGWMHTSSDVDAGDAYVEKITRQNNKPGYLYENKLRPLLEKKITLWYKTATGIETKSFHALFTHHGPVMAKRNGEWLSLRADNRLMSGLIQCWQRNKARSFKEYKQTLDLRGNISNNTVYADAEGNIAYWHGNRVPIRNKNYDWSKPVDGSISATEWKGLHKINETVHLINPPNGWLQNCNSTPFTVAGNNSPKRENFPQYMAPDGENFRGINAVRVLSENTKYTMEKVIAAGYDTRLAAFEVLIPALIKAFETANYKTDYSFLSEPISILKAWDFRSSESSLATTLAVHFGEKLQRTINAINAGVTGEDFVSRMKEFAVTAKEADLLNALAEVLEDLKKKYGNWKIAWGEINRYQRISADIQNRFDDNAPSLPDGFASSTWGMLPSFASRSYTGTNKRYGYNGNSFICVVEFGEKIKARSLLTGGQSGDPNSKHFFDQGLMYTKGQFKDVLFYREDVMKHAERTYHPGE
jgi:acyl-homoserine lactone acylase PvdQ